MQGREEGRQEGEYSFLLRLVQCKFHHIPELYRKKMAKADTETLLAWGERILDAKNLEDIFSD